MVTGSANPSGELGWQRDLLVGRLRRLVAAATVKHLEPDLVILDELQRFKDLLDADEDSARLARSVFDHPDAKVLLLSATPYKMYSLPDEPEGDDHYRDFTRTVRFLAGDERAHVVEDELRAMRECLISGGEQLRASEARDRIQHELRRVMCRTERLSVTPDRDGMLVDQATIGLQLTAQDLRSWRTFDEVARRIDRYDVFEYWRSTPYPLNLMERDSYQIRKRFQAAAERGDHEVGAALAVFAGAARLGDRPHLPAGRSRERQDAVAVPGRAGQRQLALGLAAADAAILRAAGAYADPASRTFTKRLIFSAWAVVPKAVAVMVSYEAERRAVDASGYRGAYDDRPLTPPLQFRMTGDWVSHPACGAMSWSSSVDLTGQTRSATHAVGSATTGGHRTSFGRSHARTGCK